MSVLDRLAHARALDRLSPARARPVVAPSRSPSSAASCSCDPAFERHERSLALAPLPIERRARSFAASSGAAMLRSRLLGGCLARVALPDAPNLARDLVCLGARQPGRAVFLDTETTGLGGVAVPFVVGLAWVEGDDLRCVQWTLSRCGGEAELLAEVFALLESLDPAPLVSFNGASFDLPLLRLRARRYGLSARVLEAEHIDLLHPARRMHRGRGRGDCKLSTLEAELLGIRRHGDIDSAEIPEVFWDWVQSPHEPRARRRLEAVCDHNLVDLVSLPALAARLGAAVREPGDLDRALRAARHLGKIGASEQARLALARWIDLVERPLAGPVPTPAWCEAALELATLERRAGNRRRAAELWRLAWLADPGCARASEAWAKHLEHHLGDLAGALRVARCSRRPCERRIARLEARIARSLGRDPEPEVAKPKLAQPEVTPDPAPPPAPDHPVAVTPSAPRASAELLTRIDETERGAVVRYHLLR